jgi:membrane-associated protein
MFNAAHIIQSHGLIFLGLFLFSEVGLFLGFFLPGDTLLLTAGIYAMQGKLPIAGVVIVAALAAIAGDTTAYLIGRHLGRRIFKKEESALFNPKHVIRAEKFYEKYGARAVLIAHYLPVVRTFTPLVGGVAKMPYPKFLAFDAAGDVSWAVAISLLGYYVASKIPNIDHYVLIVVAAVIILSASPTIIQIVRYKFKKRAKQTKDV